ncbi:iron chelate uptake ABC transporter family permease subunit [Dactylosporangium sp. NPDC000555]|uniref:FecCD family ABC transporter permease n=1 Tax=Dactylosporangium sp. NPDC000555 TaxID=3154260 RepID=UPI00331815AF
MTAFDTTSPPADRPIVRGRVLRIRGDSVSLRWQPRTVLLCAILAAASVVLSAFSLTTGDYPVPLSGVIDSLLGRGTGAESFIVVTLRLPRLVAALLIGAALGMSGAVFQSLSRNPLGSPDIVGFTSGAATGAVAEILIHRGGQSQIAGAAILGGLTTALVVYLLSVKRGKVAGYRLVLVGIGVSAVLTALTSYLLTRAELYDAQNAQIWLIGSLNAVGWNVVGPLVVTLAVLTPVTVVAGRTLGWMEMGDESAKGLGVPIERTRLVLVVSATALAAAATAAAGPIGFVALAAPQLCRRLTRSAGALIVPAAFMGGLLLCASDFAAQRAIPSTPLPVGVATGVIGGGYLCWLLAHEWKAGRS